MRQTRGIVLKSTQVGGGEIIRLPFLPVESGQVIELAPLSANTGNVRIGLYTGEAAQRGPWVAVLAPAGVPRVVTVANTEEVFAYFESQNDSLLVQVRDPQTYSDSGSHGTGSGSPVISPARGFGGGGAGGGGLA